VSEPPPVDASTPNVVHFDHVTKRFGNVTVIREVSFSVPDLHKSGEFF
jgi:ABC-type uncharacterized transport system ATPase subunit